MYKSKAYFIKITLLLIDLKNYFKIRIIVKIYVYIAYNIYI